MKNKMLPSVFLLLSVQFCISSCNKKAIESNPNFSLTEFLTTAPWKISFFKNGATDVTADFDNYTFTFLSNGKIYAANSAETITGSWANENSATQLDILISGKSSIPYISKKWLVVSTENSSLVLQENNSGIVSELRLVRK